MSWQSDPLLDGFEQMPLALPLAVPAAGEPDTTPLQATLVRHGEKRHARAVLYVHGWSDYFFQVHEAAFFEDLGFDFYAIDLRRYGRSLGEGQLGGYITDLDEYAQELDAALEVIRADHDRVTLLAHSTGGLVVSLWAERRHGELNGMILNSPWLDMHGTPVFRTLTSSVMKQLGGRYPTTVLNLPDSGVYARTIHNSLDGEWDFDLGLKQHPSFLIRVGWLNAILKGHKRVSKGLDIDTPVLTLISSRSDFRRTWDESLFEVDTVLDVEKLAASAVHLGRHVTVARVPGGLHDLALSREAARAIYFDEIRRWVGAYVA